jgi:hypothetical protein
VGVRERPDPHGLHHRSAGRRVQPAC